MAEVSLPPFVKSLFKPSRPRYLVLRGGRGSGKSYNVAMALILLAAQQPIRVLCCREIQRSIKDSVKRLLTDTIERLLLSEHFTSTDTEIRCSNGSLFAFRLFDSAQLRSC